MKTKSDNQETLRENRRWLLVDAKDKVVGRIASEVAALLRGKANPKFSPHHDSGDFVVVINAEQVRLTGNKLSDKLYRWHTGFIGGVKTETAAEVLAKKPEEIIRRAVQGMLPKSALGQNQLKKLKVYRGAEHPHAAQKVQELRAS